VLGFPLSTASLEIEEGELGLQAGIAHTIAGLLELLLEASIAHAQFVQSTFASPAVRLDPKLTRPRLASQSVERSPLLFGKSLDTGEEPAQSIFEVRRIHRSHPSTSAEIRAQR
jgi:hypothetical protein